MERIAEVAWNAWSGSGAEAARWRNNYPVLVGGRYRMEWYYCYILLSWMNCWRGVMERELCLVQRSAAPDNAQRRVDAAIMQILLPGAASGRWKCCIYGNGTRAQRLARCLANAARQWRPGGLNRAARTNIAGIASARRCLTLPGPSGRRPRWRPTGPPGNGAQPMPRARRRCRNGLAAAPAPP